MVNYLQLSAYALGFFFALDIIYILIKSNASAREKNMAAKMDRLCQFFTETNSLEVALRKALEEVSSVNSYFQKIVDKINAGERIEIALFESATESDDEFFRKLCLMMISANVSGGAGILYEAVKNTKDRMNEKDERDSKIMLNSFLLGFVLAFIMPMLFYFMLTIVQVELSGPIVYFLAYIALCSAMIEGVVFKKWASSLIKIPIVLSIFYIALFYIGPKLLGGFGVV